MILKLFVDTNVLLDVLAERESFYEASAAIWTLCEEGAVKGYISAISYNNVYYVARKLSDKKTALRMLSWLRDVFSVVALDEQIVSQAMDAGFTDFEDAIQYYSAVRCRADYLITRDASHFPKAGFPVVRPEEFLAAKYGEQSQ
ncbi:MAG: type II toxin-antitoxin system VapC family toxin [Phycisphaerae bacterium]